MRRVWESENAAEARKCPASSFASRKNLGSQESERRLPTTRQFDYANLPAGGKPGATRWGVDEVTFQDLDRAHPRARQRPWDPLESTSAGNRSIDVAKDQDAPLDGAGGPQPRTSRRFLDSAGPGAKVKAPPRDRRSERQRMDSGSVS